MFGERLKKLRKEKGLSQEELSTLLETSNANVSNWERNISKPDIDMLSKIANVFKTSTDYLLDIKKEDETKIRRLKYALQEAGIMVDDDLSIKELEKAIKIANVLKEDDKDTN